jgi:hypothetical protein
VNGLVDRAAEILDIAANGEGCVDSAIVVDRQGGLRIVDAGGWSLGGLSAEYGASAVYRIERTSATVRVEGRDGRQRCVIEQSTGGHILASLPAAPAVPHAVMLQVCAGRAV